MFNDETDVCACNLCTKRRLEDKSEPHLSDEQLPEDSPAEKQKPSKYYVAVFVLMFPMNPPLHLILHNGYVIGRFIEGWKREAGPNENRAIRFQTSTNFADILMAASMNASTPYEIAFASTVDGVAQQAVNDLQDKINKIKVEGMEIVSF